MQLTITTNFPQVQAQLEKMQADIANQALARALNRAVDGARVQMQRQIAREFNVTVGWARDRLMVRKAVARGQLRLEAELAASSKRKGRSANVIAFVEKKVTLAQARKRRADGSLNVLRVQIRRGVTKPLKGAFIGNKGRTVFEREGKQRLPIKPVQTIDVAQMFNTRRINATVIAYLQANLPRIFEGEAAYFLGRAGR